MKALHYLLELFLSKVIHEAKHKYLKHQPYFFNRKKADDLFAGKTGLYGSAFIPFV